jgi:hypothetical protein
MFVVGLKSPSTSCHMLKVQVKYLYGTMSRQSTAYVHGHGVLYYSFLTGTLFPSSRNCSFEHTAFDMGHGRLMHKIYVSVCSSWRQSSVALR